MGNQEILAELKPSLSSNPICVINDLSELGLNFFFFFFAFVIGGNGRTVFSSRSLATLKSMRNNMVGHAVSILSHFSRLMSNFLRISCVPDLYDTRQFAYDMS